MVFYRGADGAIITGLTQTQAIDLAVSNEQITANTAALNKAPTFRELLQLSGETSHGIDMYARMALSNDTSFGINLLNDAVSSGYTVIRLGTDTERVQFLNEDMFHTKFVRSGLLPGEMITRMRFQNGKFENYRLFDYDRGQDEAEGASIGRMTLTYLHMYTILDEKLDIDSLRTRALSDNPMVTNVFGDQLKLKARDDYVFIGHDDLNHFWWPVCRADTAHDHRHYSLGEKTALFTVPLTETYSALNAFYGDYHGRYEPTIFNYDEVRGEQFDLFKFVPFLNPAYIEARYPEKAASTWGIDSSNLASSTGFTAINSGNRGGNSEKQIYLSDNVTFDDANKEITIHAQKPSAPLITSSLAASMWDGVWSPDHAGQTNSYGHDENASYDYTSGQVFSKYIFQYGRMEIKASISSFSSNFSALWFMGYRHPALLSAAAQDGEATINSLYGARYKYIRVPFVKNGKTEFLHLVEDTVRKFRFSTSHTDADKSTPLLEFVDSNSNSLGNTIFSFDTYDYVDINTTALAGLTLPLQPEVNTSTTLDWGNKQYVYHVWAGAGVFEYIINLQANVETTFTFSIPENMFLPDFLNSNTVLDPNTGSTQFKFDILQQDSPWTLYATGPISHPENDQQWDSTNRTLTRTFTPPTTGNVLLRFWLGGLDYNTQIKSDDTGFGITYEGTPPVTLTRTNTNLTSTAIELTLGDLYDHSISETWPHCTEFDALEMFAGPEFAGNERHGSKIVLGSHHKFNSDAETWAWGNMGVGGIQLPIVGAKTAQDFDVTIERTPDRITTFLNGKEIDSLTKGDLLATSGEKIFTEPMVLIANQAIGNSAWTQQSLPDESEDAMSHDNYKMVIKEVTISSDDTPQTTADKCAEYTNTLAQSGEVFGWSSSNGDAYFAGENQFATLAQSDAGYKSFTGIAVPLDNSILKKVTARMRSVNGSPATVHFYTEDRAYPNITYTVATDRQIVSSTEFQDFTFVFAYNVNAVRQTMFLMTIDEGGAVIEMTDVKIVDLELTGFAVDSNSGGAVTLSWSAPTEIDVQSYTVTLYSDSEMTTLVVTDQPEVAQSTFEGLTVDNTYYVKIEAGGLEPLSSSFTAAA